MPIKINFWVVSFSASSKKDNLLKNKGYIKN